MSKEIILLKTTGNSLLYPVFRDLNEVARRISSICEHISIVERLNPHDILFYGVGTSGAALLAMMQRVYPESNYAILPKESESSHRLFEYDLCGVLRSGKIKIFIDDIYATGRTFRKALQRVPDTNFAIILQVNGVTDNSNKGIKKVSQINNYDETLMKNIKFISIE